MLALLASGGAVPSRALRRLRRNTHYFSGHNGHGLKSPQHIVRPCGASIWLKSPQRICAARATTLRIWLRSPRRTAHLNDRDRREGALRSGYFLQRGGCPRQVDASIATHRHYLDMEPHKGHPHCGAYAVRFAALNAADRRGIRGGREGTAQAVPSTRRIDWSPRVPPRIHISGAAVPNRGGVESPSAPPTSSWRVPTLCHGSSCNWREEA